MAKTRKLTRCTIVLLIFKLFRVLDGSFVHLTVRFGIIAGIYTYSQQWNTCSQSVWLSWGYSYVHSIVDCHCRKTRTTLVSRTNNVSKMDCSVLSVKCCWYSCPVPDRWWPPTHLNFLALQRNSVRNSFCWVIKQLDKLFHVECCSLVAWRWHFMVVNCTWNCLVYAAS